MAGTTNRDPYPSYVYRVQGVVMGSVDCDNHRAPIHQRKWRAWTDAEQRTFSSLRQAMTWVTAQLVERALVEGVEVDD